MLLLAGRDIEERESAFKGMLEILNPVVGGIRSMEAIKPAELISEALKDRNWNVDNFVNHLFYRTAWSRRSTVIARRLLCNLLIGVNRIDHDAASMLSFGFGCPAKYWLNIQTAYDKSKGLKQ
jgi:plasmid maintenance system antidote protein VapI